MVGGRDGRHGHSQAERRNLSTVQEVGAKETDRDEGIVQVNEAASSNHSRLVLVTERSTDGEGDHAARHTSTADDEDGSTTEAINGEEGEERGQELPGEGSAGESLGGLSIHTEILLEENVGVDADEVGAAHLLVELEKETENESVEELVLTHLEHVAKTSSLVGGFLEGVLDTGDLSKNLGGVDGETSKGSDNMTGLFGSALHDEPSRALGEEVDGDHEDEGEGNGDCNRGSPGNRAIVELEEAKVDPGLEDIPKADEETGQDDLTTTVSGSRCFTLPDGDDGAKLTNTETDDDSADNELSKAEGRSLEDLADEGADGGEEDDVATSKLVTCVRARQRTDEGTDDEGRDNEALESRLATLLSTLGVDGVDLGECLDPVLLGQETSDSSLVVAKEDEGRGDNGGNLEHGQRLAVDSHVCRCAHLIGCRAIDDGHERADLKLWCLEELYSFITKSGPRSKLALRTPFLRSPMGTGSSQRANAPLWG
ncbi:hypothetical protein HG530_003920 [Fusarium avenaceum]|nr:hypothetical protein HG530_003920 [Fusarium avenaceum]